MENSNEIQDAGDVNDVDEADQLPVKNVVTFDPIGPFCYICNSMFVEFGGEKHLSTGVYCGEDSMLDTRFWARWDWTRYYRLILFHPKKRICRLSGVSQWVHDSDIEFHTRQAPWDENTGIIRPEDGPSKHKNLLATALQHEARHLDPRDRLTCFIVHSQCWKLLGRHNVWSLVEHDLSVLVRAFSRKCDWSWRRQVESYNWPKYILTEENDPFQCDAVDEIIRRARRRRRPKLQHTETYLSRLSPEVLLLIADLLSSADVAAMQKGMGSYLGDAYWRSRIPDLFHEVQDSVALDWEFLCIELEKLATKAYASGDIWDYQLKGRHIAIFYLDQLADFVADGSNTDPYWPPSRSQEGSPEYNL
ncbi:hypothetical protein BJX99DRAFT_226523 [Aspergillus californicus]